MRSIGLVLLLATAVPATAGPPVMSPVELAETIAALTAPDLAGRGAGTPEEHAAAALVASWFAAAGLAPAGEDSGTWFQDVPLPADLGVGISRNVIGSLPGRGDRQDRWIVVGAHLDHLGRVNPAAGGVPRAGEYYPGAGDNASGIAVLRAVARAAAAIDPAGGGPARRSLLVCAFGAEEVGLVGSAFLVANPPVPLDRIDAMVNLDAVGRLGAGPLHVAGLATSPPFADLLAVAAADQSVHRQDPALLRSDHVSFLDQGVPALFLFTGAYPEMNSPADSLAAVDLAGLATVADVTARLVDALRTAPGPFAFVAPGPAAALPAGGNRTTWLGTVPDFAGDKVAGYVVGAVVAEGPAARAGLRAKDVLVSLGGAAVTDLATFTAALRRHDPGEVVEVRVERDGRQLGFYVTLGDRSQRPR